MPNTWKTSILVQKQIDILTPQLPTLGFADIYYGDESLIPEYPAITVEGGTVSRRVQEAAGGNRFATTISTILTIYHGKVQAEGLTQKKCEELAESVQVALHANKTMDGLVVYGFVTNVEPGFAFMGSQGDILVKATRLQWEGVARTQEP